MKVTVGTSSTLTPIYSANLSPKDSCTLAVEISIFPFSLSAILIKACVA